MSDSAVTVSLLDLKAGHISLSTLEAAFGPGSLGILIVKDIDSKFAELRLRVLSYSSYLGNLPAVELAKLEIHTAKYLTGWSLGKETLKNGQIDTLKGSYYANCAFYVDPALSCAKPIKGLSLETFPEYLCPNIWPSQEVLPGFREAFQDLCNLIIDTAVLVAQACDLYAETMIEGYIPGYLQHVVKSSTTTKARLLHYFPSPTLIEQDIFGTNVADAEDDWCATHIDHGCLTGLTSAMFIDEKQQPPTVRRSNSDQNLRDLPPLAELPSPPDPQAGLYIRSRTGKTVQVKIPKDCIGFQTGETLEKITKGRFKAVPHFVKGIRPGFGGGSVARNTLAVFTQPNLGDLVDTEKRITFAEFAGSVIQRNTTS